jgi:16S rRNA (cytosine967-C5)-methyltransferase
MRPRAVAIDALVEVERGAYANVMLPRLLRTTDLAARDRALVTDMVYGTLRRRRTLDALIAPLLDRPLDALDPPVRAALRVGAFQLFDGVAAHAAVSETVDAIGAIQPSGRGYTNAILRRVSELGPPWPLPEGSDTESVGVRTSMPNWIVEMLTLDLGPDAARGVFEAANLPAAITLRPNRRVTTTDALAQELENLGATVERGLLDPDALVVRGLGDLRASPPIAEGRATPQDQASQVIATIVGATPGERVLEIGAAPGGKATGAAEQIDDDGLVVALDVNGMRARLIVDAARRLGLTSVVSVIGDGRATPFPDASFDRVLIDAPCSGLGVMRRRPDVRWRITPQDVDQLAALQRELLGAAARLVRPGGLLVYSVCTLTAAETTGVDAWAADTLAGYVEEPPPPSPWVRRGRGALLLPQVANSDGMYVLALRKSAYIEAR